MRKNIRPIVSPSPTRRQFLQSRLCCRNCVVRRPSILARAKLERQAEHRLHWCWWARRIEPGRSCKREHRGVVRRFAECGRQGSNKVSTTPASSRTFAACMTMRASSMPWSSALASIRTRMATHGGTEGREACLLREAADAQCVGGSLDSRGCCQDKSDDPNGHSNPRRR